MDNKIILSPISLIELEQMFGHVIEEKLIAAFALASGRKSDKNEQYVTRKEVSHRLRISLPTLHSLTKQEVIKGYRIGGRVLYKWDEVEKVLTHITTTKYKRKDFLSK